MSNSSSVNFPRRAYGFVCLIKLHVMIITCACVTYVHPTFEFKNTNTVGLLAIALCAEKLAWITKAGDDGHDIETM